MTTDSGQPRSWAGLHMKVQLTVLVLLVLLMAGAVALAVVSWFRTAT